MIAHLSIKLKEPGNRALNFIFMLPLVIDVVNSLNNHQPIDLLL